MKLLAIVLPAVSLLPVFAAAEGLELPKPDPAHAEWRPAGELATLLGKMRDASAASQKVFEPLTAEQMNWRPPNGTHTPRWNAEHLAATQLLFFSEVFTAIDSDHHEVIRINPKQSPDDYAAAHPEWSGADEAAQLKAISDYIQGFAYLLEGADLEAQAPGSRWKLGRLLRQMDRHFAQHTANVKKKFELPDWPGE